MRNYFQSNSAQRTLQKEYSMPKIKTSDKTRPDEKMPERDPERSVYLGPVQITEEDNEWNKRALKIAARELQAVPVAAV
jgi:hypothetical protein